MHPFQAASKSFTREECLARLRKTMASGRPIIGAGAGTGISAKCAEAGADVIVARRLGSQEVIETLADVMLVRGIPEYLHSDYGPEFVALELRKWLAELGTGTLYFEPGNPWENGYGQSFNGKLRD